MKTEQEGMQRDATGAASWATGEATFLSEIVETQSDLAAVELDLRTILRVVVERAQRLTGADGASVQLVEGDHLTCRAVSGIMGGQVGRRFRLDESLAGQAIRAARHVYCPDVAAADARVDRAAVDGIGVRSFIVAPILHGAVPVGVLNVCSGSPAAFGPQPVAGLRLMAGLVATTLAHVTEFEAKKALLAERTEALAALRDSEERFRSAFDHAAIGMALVGLDGRWLQVNESLCRIVGYTPSELLTRDFQSITHPDDLGADMAHVRRLLAGEVRDYQMIKRYLHRQGHLVWVLLSVSLVRDADGQPRHFIAQIQDITQRKATEDALRASRDEYQATFDMAGVGKAQIDVHTDRFARVNGKLCEMLGYAADDLLTRTFAEVTHPGDLPASREAMERMRRGELRNHVAEHRLVRRDGRSVWTLLNATLIHDAGDRPARVICTIQDVTERKRSERLERDRRRVLEMVAQDAPLPDVLGQLATAIEPQMPGARAAVLALQEGEVVVHGPMLPDEWRGALRTRALSLASGLAAGAWQAAAGCGVSYVAQDPLWGELRSVGQRAGIAACWTVPIRANDSTALGVLAAFCGEGRPPTTDETQTLAMSANLAAICIEHHNATRQLIHLVRHDPLTGLANRLMFHDRLQHALDLAARNGGGVGVMLVDLDRFKAINDTYGHDAGDQVLQQFARRLRDRLRTTDTLARLGGDEFAIVLPGLHARADAAALAEKLVGSLATPFQCGDRSLRATGSFGIALYPDDGADAVALLKRADEALYRVKARGRNGYSF